MADHRLRQLERAAASNDGNALLAYATELERTGQPVEAAEARWRTGEESHLFAYLRALCATHERGEALLVFADWAPRGAQLMVGTSRPTWDYKQGMIHEVYDMRNGKIPGCGKAQPERRAAYTKQWIPSEREDCGGSGSQVRAPSRAYGLSYLRRCRTKAHAANLVDAALRGEDVPPDVIRAVCRRALHYWNKLDGPSSMGDWVEMSAPGNTVLTNNAIPGQLPLFLDVQALDAGAGAAEEPARNVIPAPFRAMRHMTPGTQTRRAWESTERAWSIHAAKRAEAAE